MSKDTEDRAAKKKAEEEAQALAKNEFQTNRETVLGRIRQFQTSGEFIAAKAEASKFSFTQDQEVMSIIAELTVQISEAEKQKEVEMAKRAGEEFIARCDCEYDQAKVETYCREIALKDGVLDDAKFQELMARQRDAHAQMMLTLREHAQHEWMRDAFQFIWSSKTKRGIGDFCSVKDALQAEVESHLDYLYEIRQPGYDEELMKMCSNLEARSINPGNRMTKAMFYYKDHEMHRYIRQKTKLRQAISKQMLLKSSLLPILKLRGKEREVTEGLGPIVSGDSERELIAEEYDLEQRNIRFTLLDSRSNASEGETLKKSSEHFDDLSDFHAGMGKLVKEEAELEKKFEEGLRERRARIDAGLDRGALDNLIDAVNKNMKN